MLSKRRIIKCIAVLVILVFTHEQIGWVQESGPVWTASPHVQNNVSDNPVFDNVEIPYDVGEIADAHINGGNEVIINIQDAHSSLSAQHSISNILSRLVSDYDIRLIALEGADGYVDTSILRTFPDKAVRDRTADFLMKEGKLSAGEFFSITKSGKKIELYGVEDDELYAENLESFRAIVGERSLYAAHLAALSEQLDALSGEIYSEKLRTFEKTASLHRAGDISFSDYWSFIIESSFDNVVDVRDFDSIAALVKAIELEKIIDFNKANVDRKKLIDVLSRELDRQDMETLVLRSLLFKQGKVSPADYHKLLMRFAEEYAVDMGGYADLARYTEYISLYHNIDIISLYAELDLLEEGIRRKLYRNAEEEELYEWIQLTGLLSKLYSVELSHRDYRSLMPRLEACTASGCTAFIRANCLKYGIGIDDGYDAGMIFGGIDEAIDFYHVAEERNMVMINNTLKQMRSDNTHAAALITGGFHTGGLTELMKENNMSYLVVVPKFEGGKERPYIAVLTNRKKSYEKLIETGKYNIAVKAYFQDMNEVKLINTAIYALADVVARGGDWKSLASLWLMEYAREYEKLRGESEDKVKGSLAPDDVKKILNELTIERSDDSIIVERTIDEKATYFRLSPGDDGVLGSPRELPSSRGSKLLARAKGEKVVVPAIAVKVDKEFPGLDLAIERIRLDRGTYYLFRDILGSQEDLGKEQLMAILISEILKITGIDLNEYIDNDNRVLPAIEDYIAGFKTSSKWTARMRVKDKASMRGDRVREELGSPGKSLYAYLNRVISFLGLFAGTSALLTAYVIKAGTVSMPVISSLAIVFTFTIYIYLSLVSLRSDIVKVLEAGGNYEKVTVDGDEKIYPDIITVEGRRLLPYYKLSKVHYRMLENYYSFYQRTGSKLFAVLAMAVAPPVGRVSGPGEYELVHSLVDTYAWLPVDTAYRLTGDKRLLNYKFNPELRLVALNGMITAKVAFEPGRAEYKARTKRNAALRKRGIKTEEEIEKEEREKEERKATILFKGLVGIPDKEDYWSTIDSMLRVRTVTNWAERLSLLEEEEEVELHNAGNCPLCRVLNEEPYVRIGMLEEDYLVAVQTSPFAKGHMMFISERPDPQVLTITKITAAANFMEKMGSGYEAIFNGFDPSRVSKAHKHFHWQVFETTSGLWSNYEAGFLKTRKLPSESGRFVTTEILDNWIVPGKVVRSSNLAKVSEAVFENTEEILDRGLIPSVNMRYVNGEYVFVIFAGKGESKHIVKAIDPETEMAVGAAERSGYIVSDTEKVFLAVSGEPALLRSFLEESTAPVILLAKKREQAPERVTTRVMRYLTERTQFLKVKPSPDTGEEEETPAEDSLPFAEPGWFKTPLRVAAAGMALSALTMFFFNGNAGSVILLVTTMLSIGYAFGFGLIKHFVLGGLNSGWLRDGFYSGVEEDGLVSRAEITFEELRSRLLRKEKRSAGSGTEVVIVTEDSDQEAISALGGNYAAYIPGRDKLFLSEKLARAPDWILAPVLSHELAHIITQSEFLANIFMFRNLFTSLRLRTYAEFYSDGEVMSPVAELITVSNERAVLDDLENFAVYGEPKETFDIAMDGDILTRPEILRRLLSGRRSIFIAKNIYAENEYTYRFSIEPGNPLNVDLGDEFSIEGRTQPDSEDSDLYGTRMAPGYSDMSKALPGGWYYIVNPNGFLWYSFSRELDGGETGAYNKFVNGIDYDTSVEAVSEALAGFGARVEFDPAMISRSVDRTEIAIPAWRQKLLAAAAAFILILTTAFFVLPGAGDLSGAVEKELPAVGLSVNVKTPKEAAPDREARVIKIIPNTDRVPAVPELSLENGIEEFRTFLLTGFAGTIEATRPGEGKWTSNERDRERFFSGIYDENAARERVQQVNDWLADNWEKIAPVLPEYARRTKSGEERPEVQQKALFLILALDPGLFSSLESRGASIYTSAIVPAHGITGGSRWAGRWGVPIIKIHEDLASNPAGFAIALQHESVHGSELPSGRLGWWWQKTTNFDFLELFGTALPSNEVRAYTREAEFEKKLFNVIPTDGKTFFADRYDLGIKYIEQKNAFAFDGWMIFFLNLTGLGAVVFLGAYFLKGRRFYAKFTEKAEELRRELGTDSDSGKDRIDLVFEKLVYEGELSLKKVWSEHRAYEELVSVLRSAGMESEAIPARMVKYARRYIGADKVFRDKSAAEINERLHLEEYEHAEQGMKKIPPGALDSEKVLRVRKFFAQDESGEWDFRRGNGVALVAGYGFEGEINTELSKLFKHLRILEPDPSKLYLTDTDSIHLTIAGLIKNTEEVEYSEDVDLTRERMFAQIRDITSKYGPIGVKFYYKDLSITPAGEIVALGYVTNDELFNMREEFDKRGISFRKTGIVHATIGRIFDENISRGQFEKLKAYIEGIRDIYDVNGDPALIGEVEVDRLDIWDQRGATKALRFRKTHLPIHLYGNRFLSRSVSWYRKITGMEKRDKVKLLQAGLAEDPGDVNHAVMLFKMGISEKLRKDTVDYLESKGFEVARVGKSDGVVGMDKVLTRWGKGSGLEFGVKGVGKLGINTDEAVAAMEDNDGDRFMTWFLDVDKEHGSLPAVKELKYSIDCLNRSVETVIVRYRGPRSKLVKDFDAEDEYTPEQLESEPFQDIFKKVVVGATNAYMAKKATLRGQKIVPALSDTGEMKALYRKGVKILLREDLTAEDLDKVRDEIKELWPRENVDDDENLRRLIAKKLVGLIANGIHCPKKEELFSEIDDYLPGRSSFEAFLFEEVPSLYAVRIEDAVVSDAAGISLISEAMIETGGRGLSVERAEGLIVGKENTSRREYSLKVCRLGRRVVGYAFLEVMLDDEGRPSLTRIVQVAVDKEFRKRNVARALIANSINSGLVAGCRDFDFHALNPAMEEILKPFGFKRVGEKAVHGVPAISFSLRGVDSYVHGVPVGIPNNILEDVHKRFKNRFEDEKYESYLLKNKDRLKIILDRYGRRVDGVEVTEEILLAMLEKEVFTESGRLTGRLPFSGVVSARMPMAEPTVSGDHLKIFAEQDRILGETYTLAELREGLERDPGIKDHAVMLFKVGIPESLKIEILEYLKNMGFDVVRAGKIDGSIGLSTVLKRWGKGSGLEYSVNDIERDLGLDVSYARAALDANNGDMFYAWFQQVKQDHGDNEYVKALQFSIEGLNRSIEGVIVRYNGTREQLVKDFAGESEISPDELETMPFQDIFKTIVVGKTHAGKASPESIRGRFVKPALARGGIMEQLYLRGLELVPEDDIALYANGVHCPKAGEEIDKEIDDYLHGPQKLEIKPEVKATAAPAAILSIKEIIAAEMELKDYAVKVAPWVEEILFHAITAIAAHYVFGLAGPWAITLSAGVRAWFLYLHKGALSHAPPSNADITDLSPEQILAFTHSRYGELRKHITADWNYVQVIAGAMGVEEGSDEWNDLKAISFAHDIGGILGYRPDEKAESEVLEALKTIGVTPEGKTPRRLLDALAEKDVKLSVGAYEFLHNADHAANSIRILDEAGIGMSRDVRLIISKHMEVPTDNDMKVWSRRQKLLFSIFTVADSFETGNNYYKQVAGYYKHDGEFESPRETLAFLRNKKFKEREYMKPVLEKVRKLVTEGAFDEAIQYSRSPFFATELGKSWMNKYLTPAVVAVSGVVVSSLPTLLDFLGRPLGSPFGFIILSYLFMALAHTTANYIALAVGVEPAAIGAEVYGPDDVYFPGEMTLEETDFFALWEKMIGGERPNIPLLYRNQRKRVKEAQEVHGFGRVDFLSNREKVRKQVRYLFQDLSDEDRQMVLETTGRLVENMKVRRWSVKDFDRLYGLRSLARNLFVIVSDREGVSERAKRVIRGIAYSLGLLTLLMEYSMSRAKLLRDKNVSGEYLQDILDADFINKTEGEPDSYGQALLAEIRSFEEKFESNVRAEVLGKDLQKIEPEGSTMMAFTREDLPFVVKVVREGAETSAGRQVDFDRDVLPKVSLARRVLGGLAANTLDIRKLKVRIDGRDMIFHDAIIQAKVKPLYHKIVELNEIGDEAAKEETRRIMKMWWDLQIRMWKRGVVDAGIKLWANYGYDEIADRVVIYDFNNVDVDKNRLWSEEYGATALEAYSPKNAAKLREIGAEVDAAEAYESAMSDAGILDIAYASSPGEIDIEVWPSSEDLASEEFFIPLNDPFMVDSKEFARLVPALESALEEGLLADEGRMTDESIESMLAFLERGMRWFHAEREYGLAASVHPSAGALRRSIAVSMEEVEPEALKELPFPVNFDQAPDLTHQMLARVHDVLASNMYKLIGLDPDVVKDVSIENVEFLVGRDIVSMRINTDDGPKLYSLILYKRGYNLDAEISDPYERIASRLMGLYKNFRLKEYEGALKDIGIDPNVVVGHVKDTFRDSVIDQDLIYFDQGSDAVVYSNQDKTVVVKELKEMDPEKMKQIAATMASVGWHESTIDSLEGYKIAHDQLGHLFIRFHIVEDFKIRVKNEDGSIEEKTLKRAVIQKRVPIFFKEKFGGRKCIGVLADAITAKNMETAKMLIDEFLVSIKMMMNRGVLDWDIKTENYGYDPSTGHIGSLDAGKFKPGGQAEEPDAETFYSRLKETRGMIRDWAKLKLDSEKAEELAAYFEQKTAQIFSDSSFTLDISDPLVVEFFDADDLVEKNVTEENVLELPLEAGPLYDSDGREIVLSEMSERVVTFDHGEGIPFPTLSLYDDKGERFSTFESKIMLYDAEGNEVEVPLFNIKAVNSNTVKVAFLESFNFSGKYKVEIQGRGSLRQLERDSGDDFFEVLRDWARGTSEDSLPVAYTGTEKMKESAIRSLASDIRRGLGSDDPKKAREVLEDLERMFSERGFAEIKEEYGVSMRLEKPYLSMNSYYLPTDSRVYSGVKVRETGDLPRAYDALMGTPAEYDGKELSYSEIDAINKYMVKALMRFYDHEQFVYDALAETFGLDKGINVVDKLAVEKEFGKIKKEDADKHKDLLEDLLGITETGGIKSRLMRGFDRLREKRRYPFSVTLDNFIVQKEEDGNFLVELESFGGLIAKAREIEVVEHMNKYLEIPYEIIFESILEEMGKRRGAIFIEKLYFQAEEGSEVRERSRKKLKELYSEEVGGYLSGWMDQEGMFREVSRDNVMVIGINKKVYEGLDGNTKRLLNVTSDLRVILLTPDLTDTMLDSFNELKGELYPRAMITALVDIEPKSGAAENADGIIEDFITDINEKIFILSRPEFTVVTEENISRMKDLPEAMIEISEKYMGRIRSLGLTEKSIFDIRAENIYKLHREDYTRTAARYLERLKDGRFKRYKRHYVVTGVDEAMDLKLLAESIAERREAMELRKDSIDPVRDIVVLKNDSLAEDLDEILKTTGLGRYLSTDSIIVLGEDEEITPDGVLARMKDIGILRFNMRNVAIANKAGVITIDHNDPGEQFSSAAKDSMLMVEMSDGLVSQLYKLTLEIMANGDKKPEMPIDGILNKLSGFNFFTFLPNMDRIDLDGEVRAYERYVQEVLIRA